MSKFTRCCQSSIGKKWIVALTGLVLVAYVLGHLAGNLQIFLPDKGRINAYGAFLHSLGPLLWAIRVFLLACLIVHIVTTIQLAIENRRARPERYEGVRYRKAGWASRSMVMSGLIVLCFVIFHILHFTTMTIRPDFANLKEALPNGTERHDVYRMVVEGFQQPAASCFYILGMILLCMHLSHGFGSLVQTLGLNTSKLAPWLINGGRALAVIVCLGYIAIPIAVMTGNLALMSDGLDAHIPGGPIEKKWDLHKFESKLINPANRRKFDIIMVGTGLAGASAAASLGEMGYKVKCFCYQDSPRRAHSIAAQGGINASKNYPNDGDSVQRLFYDTVKGGDFRSREANVYRLAQVSGAIIDQCVAQGVPFAREYGGLLANRSFGGAQVSRTFYARGQTGQQLLLGAYGALCRQITEGNVQMFPRTEMLDLVVVDGHAKGIVVRDMVTGKISSHAGDTVVLATGGYGNVFYLSTNAKGCNVTATYRAYKKGAFFANPCYTQIHPTCIPVSGDYQSKLTLMSESLRNDGRVWAPKKPGDKRPPSQIPEDERDYYLERKYPSYGNLAPRDIASRAAKQVCDEGRGVGDTCLGVYLDFADSIARLGVHTIRERYGNLFDMYHKITNEDAYKSPMRIFPAVHYTMGGLWVDYNLMSNLPGLHVLGEANFSDHGANRLGASALMQGLADGYFVLPATIGNYLATQAGKKVKADAPEFKKAEEDVHNRTRRLLGIRGKKTVDHFHRELGLLMWDKCGMARNDAGLREALKRIPQLREEFWENVNVLGDAEELNQSLEKAGRVADFLQFGELLCYDALNRRESCGGHFREEFQTADGEAKRNDEEYAYVSAWEYVGEGGVPQLHKEPLHFEATHLATRSYK